MDRKHAGVQDDGNEEGALMEMKNLLTNGSKECFGPFLKKKWNNFETIKMEILSKLEGEASTREPELAFINVFSLRALKSSSFPFPLTS